MTHKRIRKNFNARFFKAQTHDNCTDVINALMAGGDIIGDRICYHTRHEGSAEIVFLKIAYEVSAANQTENISEKQAHDKIWSYVSDSPQSAYAVYFRKDGRDFKKACS